MNRDIFWMKAGNVKLINDYSVGYVFFFLVSAQHSDWSGALVQSTPTQFDSTPLHPAKRNRTQSTTSQVNAHCYMPGFILNAHFL